MKTKAVQILVRRSLSSTPSRVVDAHEVPILKVIKGAGSIEIVDPNFVGGASGPRTCKSRDELIRLKKKYRAFSIEGQSPVDVAFPDGSRDLELYYKDPDAFADVGEEEGGGMLEDDVADEVEVVDDEGEVVADTPEEDTSVNLNDRASVVAALESAGVPFAKTTATKHLAALLTKSLEEDGAE